MTTDTGESQTNQKKIKHLRDTLEEFIAASQRRGFYGTLGVEFSVQDGVIQHVKRRAESIVK
jgi:hypothetical protein